MLPTLNCILLIDDDKLPNFMNKMIMDEVSSVEQVIRKESAKTALEYISSSVNSQRSIHFPDLTFRYQYAKYRRLGFS